MRKAQHRTRLVITHHRATGLAGAAILQQATLLAGALVAIFLAMPNARAAAGFGFETVVTKARTLAQQPDQHPEPVADQWAGLSFDQWTSIRYREDRVLWPESDFHVQFFPAGYLYPHPVAMNVVEDGEARPLDFDPSRYDYDPERIGGELPDDLGYVGIRLLYPINQPDKYDEFVSFLGASYFRAVPKDGWFGLSTRGLAIDTALPSGEEFPRFSEFWLVKPAPDAEQVTVYALLESASATGAYRFIFHPGEETVVEVKTAIFLRKPVKKLGLAPLTSMYLYGVGDHAPLGSLFPAEHDSDGLLVTTGDGEWIWRPLANRDRVAVHSFFVDELRGFGLMQRHREFDNYQSLNMHYQDRPSAWIVPEGDWGPGHVELLEIPTDGEFNDNMVAYWVPEEMPAPGEPLRRAYSIHWQGEQPVRSPAGRVLGTMIGGDDHTGTNKFVIDFIGKDLAELPADADLRGVLQLPEDAEVIENRVERNPYNNGWRLVVQVAPRDEPTLIRATLALDDHTLTETWDYVIPPGAPGK